MGILGIVCSHDGTLSYVENGRHEFSIGEERINRVKAYIGFPFSALRYALDNGMLDPAKVDAVAVPLAHYPSRAAEMFAFILTEDKKYYDLQNDPKPKDFYLADDDWKQIKNDEDCQQYVRTKIAGLLGKHGIKAPIYFHDHHHSHAASAYYSSGLKGRKVLALTMDGEGDGLSATVSLCEDGKITRLSQTDKFNSAGYIYSAVTKKCGFKVSRHEGKITGLAAYGDPTKAYDFFAKHIVFEEGRLRVKGLKGFRLDQRIIQKILGYFGINVPIGADELIDRYGEISHADLSATIQRLLEDRIELIVRYWVQKTGVRDVVVAGGIFANVKFNQRIGELDCVDSLFVFPDMGDGGTAYGAAMLTQAEQGNFSADISKLETVYLGPEFSDEAIESFLREEPSLTYSRSGNVAAEAAALIADKKIVGWFQGRMEYGPRALGHRSILATPVDASINKWLNDRMKRTEFMPFAPSCLYEYADELFDIPKDTLKRPAEFMTITFRMKSPWAERAPAVAHVDKTARPQLVRKEKEPLYHALLTEFNRLTGLPLVINTSFNVHEEPIVCHPREAIKAVTTKIIDVLAIGNYIVRLK